MDVPSLPAAGARWALFLDVDGTLVAIAPTPQAVRVEPGLARLLERLRRDCGGALALVSGRRLADIDTLFEPLLLPAAGLHGLERRRADGGLVEMGGAEAALAAVRPALAAYAASRDGVLFEDKGRTIALHYRLAPRYGASARLTARRLRDQAGGALRLIEGKKVVEFQPLGCDKGRAIAAFLAEPPFAGRRPVFAGDDTTDEDGFAAVNALGGLSIKVTPPRRRALATAAQHRLPSVAALHQWLAMVADRLEGVQETVGTAAAARNATDPFRVEQTPRIARARRRP